MRVPKMVLFDYGQTLVNEQPFDGVAGNRAVMQFAVKNKYHSTPEQVRSAAEALNLALGRYDPEKQHLFQIEIPNRIFQAYLYSSMGIEISLTPQELDRVFWDAAAPGVPTDGIAELLAYLDSRGIQTGVVSNISYCGEVVKERINRLLPANHFAFILATSEYLFRKPDAKIFKLALEMADLPPEDVWYIGDNYQCDVVGARNAGLFPVWYTGAARAIPRQDADVLTISHWDTLRELL